MFGKKDKQDGGEKVKPEKPAKVKAEKAPKVKAEKAAKPKKSKGASAKSGPNFLVAHVEKLVLGLVVAAAGYFVFAGLTTEGYPTARAPEVLAKDAGSVLTQISDDHWEAIAPEREIAHNFDELAKKARRPTDPTLYPIDVLDPKPGGTIEKRGDPKLLPPQQLVANSFVGAIAVEVKSETPDPYEAFEDADKIEVRGKNNKPQRGARGGASDGAEMGYGVPGASGEPGGSTTIATIRRLSAEYDLGAAIGAMAGGMGPGMPGGGMPDMGSGGGMPGMPGMPGAGGTRPRDGLGDPNKDRRPKTKIASQAAVFVAATALVPHKQMVEEYDRLFKNSGDYIVARDRPAYLSFEVQRVDVTQDPNREIKEDEWKIVTDGTNQLAIRKNWAILPPLGRPVPEVIDRNAVQNGLTMPIPPVLLRDYREICKHPAIDWAWNAKMLITPRKEPTRKPEFDDGALPGELGGGAGGQPGAMGGGMDMYGGGGGMDMYGSGGGGMDMYGGGGGMDMYGGGGGGMDMYGGGGGMDMYGSGGGMDMYGSGGGMGMGMDMYGGGGGPSNAPQPEFKMLRFYDMLSSKDIGKTFRYRARLIMRDPNYPERNFRTPERDAVPAPPPNSLLPEVFDRVAKLRKQDDAAFKKDPKARRTMLHTDWSEASPPVRIEGNVEVFAGVGYDSKPIPVAAAVLPDGTANLVTTKLDNFGARLAKNFTEVRRGAVLNQTKEENIDFIVPLTKVIKKRLMKPPYASNVVVVDMRGGEELAASNRREDPLATSGEVMVLLQDGSVQITSDLDDTFEYRMYTFADEYERAEGGGTTGAGAAGGGDSPMMSGP